MFALAECEPHKSILGCIPSKYAACDPRMHQQLVALDSGRERPIGVPDQTQWPVRRPAHGLAKSIQPTVAARAAVGGGSRRRSSGRRSGGGGGGALAEGSLQQSDDDFLAPNRTLGFACGRRGRMPRSSRREAPCIVSCSCYISGSKNVVN